MGIFCTWVEFRIGLLWTCVFLMFWVFSGQKVMFVTVSR